MTLGLRRPRYVLTGAVGPLLSSLQQELNYMVENPSLDLEVTSNAYSGLAKLYRLQFIAEHCPVYTVEALKLAIR